MRKVFTSLLVGLSLVAGLSALGVMVDRSHVSDEQKALCDSKSGIIKNDRFKDRDQTFFSHTADFTYCESSDGLIVEVFEDKADPSDNFTISCSKISKGEAFMKMGRRGRVGPVKTYICVRDGKVIDAEVG